VQRWIEYIDDLPHLARVHIPRWTTQSKENLSLEIHGFADASSRAYAAVVYLRVIHFISNFQVNLICAKTKFAPLKTISIPCLELNAVVVLNRLLSWTSSVLSLSNFPTYEWTDSTIILALKQYPSKWNTYIANRISEHYVAACFFQGESHRLHLSRVIGVNAIFSRLMVEWPYLVETLLHLVVKTRSSNASRRNDCVDLHRNAKGNRTSFGLYE
jgi:hypothetical protein